MYNLIEKAKQAYKYLEDDLSKQIFMARLAVDIDPSMSNIIGLLQLNPAFSPEEREEVKAWQEKIQYVHNLGKKLVLYGTGGRGQAVGEALLRSGCEFYCFCGKRGPAAFPDGLLGKPVIDPNHLCQNADEFYVIITTGFAALSEIMELLNENNFPQDHILNLFQWHSPERMYFEFPSLYRKGTAFIDAGCLDCGDDYRFVDWCKGEYSDIIAFEPDPVQYDKCKKRLERDNIKNLRLIEAGLSGHTGTVEFATKRDGGSRILNSHFERPAGLGRIQNLYEIQTVTLDQVIDKETVGFIKMDIEGEELEALRGAKNTIIRDNPFLAISVYHNPGDMLAIMDYLHELIPEYHFWLRHYGPIYYETVLYASIDKQRMQR